MLARLTVKNRASCPFVYITFSVILIPSFFICFGCVLKLGLAQIPVRIRRLTIKLDALGHLNK